MCVTVRSNHLYERQMLALCLLSRDRSEQEQMHLNAQVTEDKVTTYVRDSMGVTFTLSEYDGKLYSLNTTQNDPIALTVL